MSLDDYPRVALMFGPSPVHQLSRLSAALGGGVEIWAKREDCNTHLGGQPALSACAHTPGLGG
jgi:1-aminocyclopropane-1-carboxylate deaminase